MDAPGALVLRASAAAPHGALARSIAACGRMALTTYLSQSLLMTLVFYSYGLGLFGRFNYAALWAFVIPCWLAQLAFARLWLAHFRFGPVEWLWRAATYGSWPPMRHGAGLA